QGDHRTIYVAVSNSAMGFILLLVGGLSSLLALVHISWALLFLALLGILGVVASARLPDVSQG
ncbi:MAG: MFS transporter, partial [Yaniella sp.]|nr:MFS transporter [Yaniella sp.]